MNYFSYKLDHDYGLAPNPFGGYCTLAVCKPSIRRSSRLEVGDWVIGTGSVKLGCLHHLIYAMQVEEKIPFEQYWDDDRFQYKKPIVTGSLVQMYGDNFYHKDPVTGKWVQENSAHSLKDGTCNADHLKTDVGGQFVLISQTFYYFGDNCIAIPQRYLSVCCEGRDMKSPSIPQDVASEFVEWIQGQFSIGIHGDPINWEEH